jgi:hypothetical protein
MKIAKFIFVPFAFICCVTAAPAQEDAQRDAVLNSSYLAKGRECMSKLTQAGKDANFFTDREGGNILILDPTDTKKLGDIEGNMFGCLNAAFDMEAKKIDRKPGAGISGTKSWVWHAKVSGLYIWCASDGDSGPGKVTKLGGHGERKDWYGVALQCSIGDKVLGWYEP